jgi:hypothetical protein
LAPIVKSFIKQLRVSTVVRLVRGFQVDGEEKCGKLTLKFLRHMDEYLDAGGERTMEAVEAYMAGFDCYNVIPTIYNKTSFQ